MQFKLPGDLGQLEFGDWLYGLFAAFIGGGASAVTAGAAINMVDPTHFNLQTHDFYVIVRAMFLMNGIISALMFLRSKPLPELKHVTTTVQVTEQASVPSKVVTTVAETHVEPLDKK